MTTDEHTLREADRAAAAPFLDQPVTRWWYPPFMAAFFTGLAAGPVLVARGHGSLGFALQTLVLAAVVVFYVRYRRQAGSAPRMRSAPPEITRTYLVLALAGLASAAVVVQVWTAAGPAAGLSAVFCSSLVVVWAHERGVYPRAVGRVRRRLS